MCPQTQCGARCWPAPGPLGKIKSLWRICSCFFQLVVAASILWLVATSPQMGTYMTQLPCLPQMRTTTFMSPSLLGEVPSVQNLS